MSLHRYFWRIHLAATVLILGAACTGIPGVPSSYRIASVDPIGPLLGVTIDWESRAAVVSSDARRSLLFASADDCTKSFAVGTRVEFEPGGLTGGVRIDGQRCHAVGITNLREWRDRRPRRALTRHGDDRGQATYRVVFEQPDYAIVRGRFPLAAWLGWIGGEDTLALIPRTSACSAALGRQVSTIQFNDDGPNPLVLVGESPCPIAGFARVVPALGDRSNG